VFKESHLRLSDGVHAAGTLSALFAYCTHADYTGWAGIGKALLTGAGTQIGAGMGATAGAIALGALGALCGFPKQAAIAGGLAVGLYGCIQSYSITNEFVSRQSGISQTVDTKTVANPPETQMITPSLTVPPFK
jgi:hypothetical protein